MKLLFRNTPPLYNHQSFTLSLSNFASSAALLKSRNMGRSSSEALLQPILILKILESILFISQVGPQLVKYYRGMKSYGEIY
jgi:hypothetical protein